MKKLFAVLLLICLVFSLVACGGGGDDKGDGGDLKTIYILGPTADHGWTGQAGTYAQQKADEITAAGEYKGVFYPANAGSAQNDQVDEIIANGDAAGVMFFGVDEDAAAGQEALSEAGIPWISFDRWIESTMALAELNVSGDNWQVGAGCAHFMIQNGLQPGDQVVTLLGDTGTVSGYRKEGFSNYLLGTQDYYDKYLDETFTIETPWTQEQVDALFTQYEYVCGWSNATAQGYIESDLQSWVDSATTGKLYIFSVDDEMSMGFIEFLEGSAASDALKTQVEELEVYLTSIGGMEEYYAVMRGESTLSTIADTYCDDLMSVYFSPAMIKDAVDYLLAYLAGDWTYAKGDTETVQVFIVDKANVGEFTGFTGR